MTTKPISVGRHTLPNGLRLVHSYDPTTAMVAVDVLYNVGARDENRSLTGIAHLFEHLMFGGSVNVPEFDSELEAAGGRSNAWTSNDFTNFYNTLPAQNIDTALHLESDRMLSPAFSERTLEVQRGVVIEEFKQQCLDRPYGDLFHHLRRIAYAETHPYSWPVIGLTPDHVAKVTMDDARHWFFSHYAPNNAVLAISGGIPFDVACAKAEEWFADVPSRTIAARNEPAPGFPTTPVIETVRGNVPLPVICVAFPMSSYGTPEYFAADTITDILSVGSSARLRNNLVNSSGLGLIADADASILGCEGPGLLIVNMQLAEDTDAAIERSLQLLDAELKKMTVPGNVSAHELERTLNNFEASFRFSNIGYLPLAINLAQAELHGEDINRTVTDRRRLTPEIITTTAESIFSRPSATIVYRGAVS